jgi:N-acetylglucosaminyldiphosphoundecaprenol N-acetyl-beta-D-mannosaminyltransferase
VWLLRLQGFHDVERVYGPDLMLEACRFGLPRGWNHFFYGGAPGVADRLAASLSDRYPDLQVAGTFTPPFRSLTGAEDREIIERINASGAELVWIGLSSPKQEVWMSEHKGKINAPLMIGVGAAFDFLSRRKRQAPQWMQRAGLEWLFRFASEPRRLWPRYRQYPRFMLLVLLQYLGLKSFPSE